MTKFNHGDRVEVLIDKRFDTPKHAVGIFAGCSGRVHTIQLDKYYVQFDDIEPLVPFYEHELRKAKVTQPSNQLSTEYVLTRLCIYDRRNPDCSLFPDEVQEPRKECYCDNCFYGRDKLALMILDLLNYKV